MVFYPSQGIKQHQLPSIILQYFFEVGDKLKLSPKRVVDTGNLPVKGAYYNEVHQHPAHR